MSSRNQLEKKIDNKRREIWELELHLETERAFLAGLQEALKLLPKEEGRQEEKHPVQILRPGSDMAKAREFLLTVGKPMYITDIIKAIGRELTHKTRVSVGGSLGNYARKNLIFKRTAPSTYGLIELDEETNDEPPEDFGLDDDEEGAA